MDLEISPKRNLHNGSLLPMRAIQLSPNDAKRLPFANLGGNKHSRRMSRIIINRPTAHAYNLTSDKLSEFHRRKSE